MLYKYLKLMLFTTLLLQASPKAFDSLGNEMEAFQKDCKTYRTISSLPTKIKKKCIVFNSEANNTFKFGYELDPYIDSDNISEKKLNKYLGLLRNLEKSKDNILRLIYSEAKEAREQNNIKYYSQLIAYDKIKLYSSDYEFMEKNKDIFAKNKRYLSHIQYIKDLAEQRKNQFKEDNQDTKKTQIHQQQKQDTITSSTDNTNSIIMTNCRNKWDTNYNMIKYCVDKQTKAFNSLSYLPNNIIMQNCKKKWDTNYNMIKYCVDKQSQAKRSLGL